MFGRERTRRIRKSSKTNIKKLKGTSDCDLFVYVIENGEPRVFPTHRLAAYKYHA